MLFIFIGLASPLNSYSKPFDLDFKILLEDSDAGNQARIKLQKRASNLFQTEFLDPQTLHNRLVELNFLKQMDPDLFQDLVQRTRAAASFYSIPGPQGKILFHVQEILPIWLMFHPDFQDGLKASELYQTKIFIHRSYVRKKQDSKKTTQFIYKPEVGVEVRVALSQPSRAWSVHPYSPFRHLDQEEYGEATLRFVDQLIEGRLRFVARDSNGVYFPSTGAMSEKHLKKTSPGILFHPNLLMSPIPLGEGLNHFFEPKQKESEIKSQTAVKKHRDHYFLRQSTQYTSISRRFLWSRFRGESEPLPIQRKLQLSYTAAEKIRVGELDAPEWFLDEWLKIFEEMQKNNIQIPEIHNGLEEAQEYLAYLSLRHDDAHIRKRAAGILFGFFIFFIQERTASYLLTNALFIYLQQQPEKFDRFESLFDTLNIEEFKDPEKAKLFLLLFTKKKSKSPYLLRHNTEVTFELAFKNILDKEIMEDRFDVLMIVLALKYFLDVADKNQIYYKNHVSSLGRHSPIQKALVGLMQTRRLASLSQAISEEPDTDTNLSMAIELEYEKRPSFTQQLEEGEEEIRILNEIVKLTLQALKKSGLTDPDARKALRASYQNDPQVQHYIDELEPKLKNMMQDADDSLNGGFCESDFIF